MPLHSNHPGLCFFNGWYVRVTDHERQLAFALIVGSFKHPGANTYTEHYVALVYADRQGNLLTAHAFPDPDSVTIDMDRWAGGLGGGLGGGGAPRVEGGRRRAQVC